MKIYRIIRNISLLFAMLCFFSCDKDEDLESERYDVIPCLKQTVWKGTMDYGGTPYNVYFTFLTDTRGAAAAFKDGTGTDGDFEYLVDEKLLTIKDPKDSAPTVLEGDWLLTEGGKDRMVLVQNLYLPNPNYIKTMTLTKQDYSN